MTRRPLSPSATLLGLLLLCPAVPANAGDGAGATAAPTARKAAPGQATARAPGPAGQGPRASAAWIAEAPPGARNNAAYLVLRNGSRADTLLAVETPVASVVELHEMRMDRGVMRMRQEKSVDLAAGAELHLAPGGRHLMLIGMKRSLRVGEQVPLVLRFRHAGQVTAMAEVRPLVADADATPAAGQGGEHHHHGH